MNHTCRIRMAGQSAWNEELQETLADFLQEAKEKWLRLLPNYLIDGSPGAAACHHQVAEAGVVWSYHPTEYGTKDGSPGLHWRWLMLRQQEKGWVTNVKEGTGCPLGNLLLLVRDWPRCHQFIQPVCYHVFPSSTSSGKRRCNSERGRHSSIFFLYFRSIFFAPFVSKRWVYQEKHTTDLQESKWKVIRDVTSVAQTHSRWMWCFDF